MTSTARWWISGTNARRSPARARNLSPIVPRASISGRALVAVVAIMTFLASITTGAVLLVQRVGGGMAVGSRQRNHHPGAPASRPRSRPRRGRGRRGDAGAGRHRRGPAFSKDESAKLLEPWLGTGLSIEQLPVPRVIVARVQPGATPDLAALRARVLQARRPPASTIIAPGSSACAR